MSYTRKLAKQLVQQTKQDDSLIEELFHKLGDCQNALAYLGVMVEGQDYIDVDTVEEEIQMYCEDLACFFGDNKYDYARHKREFRKPGTKEFLDRKIVIKD